jgi:hypothetical protein
MEGPERVLFARVALDALRRMALGELTGYDVRRAEPQIIAALRGDDTAGMAMEILSRLSGYQAQRRLADFVLFDKRGPLRVKAAEELNRHVKKYGLALTPEQSTDLRALFANVKTDPNLRAQLGVLVGQLQPTKTQSGQQLLQFDPLAK